MSRCLSGACAGVMLLTVAGCLDSFLAPPAVVWGPKIIVSGSVDELGAKLRRGLGETGILLQPKNIGDEYRIASQSASGKVFCLHLSPAKGAGGKKTLVRMQWDRGGDEELWTLVLKILDATDDDDANQKR